MKIALIQPDVVWEDVEKNISNYNALLSDVVAKTELIILPEMCMTGYNVRPYHISSEMLDKQLNWMNEVSTSRGCSVMGSILVNDEKRFYNQLVLVKPNKLVQIYNKRHLFTHGGEHLSYTKGNSCNDFSINNHLIRPAICYDLRFPVWLRNNTNYHMLICVANWPAQRQYVWDSLLQARAIENQCFAIGVNRVGKDKNSINYCGGSLVYNSKGIKIGELSDKQGVLNISLDMNELLQFRKEFPVLENRDEFKLI